MGGRKVCFVDMEGQCGTCIRDDENCSICGYSTVHRQWISELKAHFVMGIAPHIRLQVGVLPGKEKKPMETMTELPGRCNHEFEHLDMISANVNQTRGGGRTAIATFKCHKCGSELKKGTSDYF